MSNDPLLFRHENPATDPKCPVCDAHKGCSTRESGQVFCRGTGGITPDGWTDLLHGQPDSQGFHHYRRTKTKVRKPKAAETWSAKAVHFASKLTGPDRVTLAANLGLPVEALSAVPLVGLVGHTLAGIVATFPEVDADGVTVGITERDPSREKKSQSMTGGERGLILPAAWDAPPGPVLAVEGATDVLACAVAGLCVVGRPGAKAKPELLAELLKRLPADRPVIVVGENDRKGNGEWPGREGAEVTAARLAALIPNPVAWAIVPDTAKDSRAYLSAATGEWAERGRVLRAHLESVAVWVDRAALPAIPPGEIPAADESDDPAKWSKTPTNPHRLARQYLATVSPDGQTLRLRYWRGEFYEAVGGAYRAIDNDAMDGRIWAWLEGEFERVYRLAHRAWSLKSKDTAGKEPKEEPVTRALVANVLGALRGICQHGLTATTEAPFWLDGATGPDPTELVACRNGLVNVATGEMTPHTPSFFTLNAVPYDHDPAAPAPAAWLRFLSQLWPDDPDSVRALQEWMGYLLTGDNSQQKMLFLFGDKRTGKGTISRVIRNLVGGENVTSTSYKSLDDDFGLWPLLGKSVAVIGDSREVRGDEIGGTALERILNITGQDEVLVNRKQLSMFSAALNLRFVVLSNDLPRVTDTSGAFVSRIVLLHFRQSFAGREDTGLLPKLLAELPGIFSWAITGLRRLRARGRFLQPATGAAKLNLVSAGASPITEFVADRCRVGDGYSVPCKELLDAWKKWCEENNRDKPGTAQTLGIKLASVPGCSNVERRRMRKNGDLVWCYVGIRVRDIFEEYEDVAQPAPQQTAQVFPPVPDVFLALGHEGGHYKPLHNKDVTASVPDVPPNSTTPACMSGEYSAIADGAQNPTPIRNEFDSGGDIRNSSHKLLDTQEDRASPLSDSGQEHVRNRGEQSEDDDLFFSSEMRLLNYPAGSASDVIDCGGSIHYRVTPSTTVTLLAMRDRAPPGPDRDALDAVLGTISAYTQLRYSPEEIAAAEARGALPLPEPPRVPMIRACDVAQ